MFETGVKIMPLEPKYPADFERLWSAYPKFPKGRSVKSDAYKAFVAVKKECEFTPADIDEIVAAIDRQKRERASWQSGHPHGPQGMQRWLRAHGWNADYPTVSRQQGSRFGRSTSGQKLTDEENAVLFVRDLIRRGRAIPADLLKYEKAARGAVH